MKPTLIFNFDYSLGIWTHRLPHHPSFLLQEACREYFTVYKRGEIPAEKADVVFNSEPIVANGGMGPDLFLQGKKTWYWEKTPYEHTAHKELIDRCDWVFVQSPSYLSLYPEKKSSVLLEAVHPDYVYIPQEHAFEFDVVFLGNETGAWRKPLLDAMEKRFRLLRFSGSESLGVPSAHLLSKGKLNLGIFDMAWEGKTGIELRTFLFGNVRPTLLHQTPDLEQAGFLPYVHFIPYQTIQDAINLTRYFLDHDTEREEIGIAMKQLLSEKHQYKHRARQLYGTYCKTA